MSEPEDYQQNVTEFAPRKIKNVYQPESLEALKAIICTASDNGECLYTISTGHNWGLGSRLPVQDASIVDLSKLNKIIEVNRELRYARVQPGVTQMQLYKYLEHHAPELMLNVTGGDSRSSIIGNMMDRGSGKNGHRADDLRELKMMLSNGSVISTGFGGNSQSRESFYPYGIGPDLRHLFTQSNYGVVTEVVIDLMIRQPFNVYLVAFDKEKLGIFLEKMSLLIGKGIVGHSLEIDSQNDPKIFELFNYLRNDQDQWYAWFTIYGEGSLLKAKDEQLRAALNKVTNRLQSFYSKDSHEDLPVPVTVRLKRYNGEPNDHSLIATARKFGVDLENKEVNLDCHPQIPGFRCVLPVIPLARHGAEIIGFVESFTVEMGLEPAISIIGLNEFSLEVFARVYFDRSDPDQIKRTGVWAGNLLEALKDQGIFPYRLDIDNMQPYLNSLDDPSWKLRSKLKQVLDPENIISPGRYNIFRK